VAGRPSGTQATKIPTAKLTANEVLLLLTGKAMPKKIMAVATGPSSSQLIFETLESGGIQLFPTPNTVGIIAFGKYILAIVAINLTKLSISCVKGDVVFSSPAVNRAI
jgi:hypothetical protein